METIYLAQDDERIGTAEKRPKVDILGNPHKGDILARQELGEGRYVILPMGLSEPVKAILGPSPSLPPSRRFGKATGEADEN